MNPNKYKVSHRLLKRTVQKNRHLQLFVSKLGNFLADWLGFEGGSELFQILTFFTKESLSLSIFDQNKQLKRTLFCIFCYLHDSNNIIEKYNF
jgi:hypothetical protein